MTGRTMNSKRLKSRRSSQILFSIFVIFGMNQLAAQDLPEKNYWTLQDCIQHALQNNIQIQEAYLSIDESEIDQNDALGNYLPGVNVQANNTWNSGLTQDVTTGILQQQTTRNFSFNTTLNVPIYNGLRNLKQWQRAKLSQIASQYALEEMKDNVLLNITNAYLNVLVNKERLGVLQQQNEVTREQLQRTRLLIQEGMAPAGDSLDIKATDAFEKQQIVNAENAIKITLINLAQLLQISNYQDFDIADAEYDVPVETMITRTPEEIIQNAKENRYEIKVAEQNLELAEKDVEIARTQLYPSLDGFVNFNTRESGSNRARQGGIDPNNPTSVIGYIEGTGENVVTDNYLVEEIGPDPFFNQLSRNKGWSYGLRLSIPVLNGFSARNSVRRNKINVLRQTYQLEQTKLNLESNVYQAYVDAQGAAEAYRAAEVAADAKRMAFSYSEDKFEVGRITSFEFSQAKFDLADAESQVVNAKFDYIFKLKLLELYFGIAPEDITL